MFTWLFSWFWCLLPFMILHVLYGWWLPLAISLALMTLDGLVLLIAIPIKAFDKWDNERRARKREAMKAEFDY